MILAHSRPVLSRDFVIGRSIWRPSVRATRSDMVRRRKYQHAREVALLNDRDLLANAHDATCVAELVQRHQGRLMAMANSMLRNRGDAEEAVQDTFVQAIRAADTFRGDAMVSTWLHSICYRQVLTRTRRKRHLTVALDSTLELTTHTADDAFRLALSNALDDLPADNREAFTLVDVLGHSRAEAASIVGIADNTMRARVARARELLANALSEPPAESP